MKLLLSCYLLVFLLFRPVTECHAAVKLPALLSDYMVLQQRSKVNLWGWAAPFARISIRPSWDEKTYTLTADETGAWKVKVATAKAGGPYRIVFNDGEERMLTNVLLGEVWVCSGQSNMVMPLKGYQGQDLLNSEQLIAGSGRYKGVRVFDVPKVISVAMLPDCTGTWKESNPGNAPGFSAIAFQYAAMLNEKLHVPVGVITACWGSTAIQSWMSERNLQHFPEVRISARIDTLKIPAKDPEAVTAALFNGMISPIRQYTIKGFLWYQGESNKDPQLYRKLFPAMVQEWRQVWGQGKLPFYYVQIAPFNATDRNTAFIREAQWKAVIPNSGMVVSLDAAQKNRIHPPDKTVISQRLLYWALAKTYHQKGIVFRGPEYRSAKFKGNTAVLTFRKVYAGLKLLDNSPVNFEIAGSDRIFYPATALVISRKHIKLQCAWVSQPVAVRYAFKSWAQGDLSNSKGLPASSFRTDHF